MVIFTLTVWINAFLLHKVFNYINMAPDTGNCKQCVPCFIHWFYRTIITQYVSDGGGSQVIHFFFAVACM